MINDYHMPVIEGVDWEKAHRYVPEKESLLAILREMVAGASKQASLLLKYRDEIKTDPSDENHDLFKVQAHAMKASVRSIGSDLFDEAYALELAGKDRDTETIIRDTDRFADDYLALSDRLRVITGDTDRQEAFDKKAFAERIQEIKTAMDAFDVTLLQGSSSKVMSMETPEILKNELAILEEGVRDLESEKVLGCCERIEDLLRNIE